MKLLHGLQRPLIACTLAWLGAASAMAQAGPATEEQPRTVQSGSTSSMPLPPAKSPAPVPVDPAFTCPPVATVLAPERVEAGMRDAVDHGFLWRITKDDRTSYLYGTIHAAQVDWMFPGPSVREALAGSDTLALELDGLDPDIQSRLAASVAAHPAGVLPEPLERRLRVRMALECVDAQAFARISPELQLASLSVLAARRDGIDPAYGIDLVLAAYARSLGKPVRSLETPEAQLESLQMPTPDASLEFVQSSLDELESGRTRPLLLRLAKAWAASDWTTMSTYAQWCECLRTPVELAFMKRLLDDRNPGLAESIDALHASGQRVFAAVGTLHMIGPLGLPSLLRQRGYKVEQGDFAH